MFCKSSQVATIFFVHKSQSFGFARLESQDAVLFHLSAAHLARPEFKEDGKREISWIPITLTSTPEEGEQIRVYVSRTDKGYRTSAWCLEDHFQNALENIKLSLYCRVIRRCGIAGKPFLIEQLRPGSYLYGWDDYSRHMIRKALETTTNLKISHPDIFQENILQKKNCFTGQWENCTPEETTSLLHPKLAKSA